MIHYLESNASSITANDRFSFPHAFRNGQSEAFSDRLLDHYVGRALKRVYDQVCVWREKQHVHILVARCLGSHLGHNNLTFGVIGGSPSGQNQL